MTTNEKIRTLYNPGVGMRYNIKNTKTGETQVASTLTVRDVDQKPWRSPKGTPAGQEFFKMKLGSKKEGFSFIKFMNSIKNTKCLSEDGQWEFVGERPDGSTIPLLSISEREIVVKEKRSKPRKTEAKEIKAAQAASPVVITADALKSDYCNVDMLNELLEKK
jgi:hypothetical protein